MFIRLINDLCNFFNSYKIEKSYNCKRCEDRLIIKADNLDSLSEKFKRIGWTVYKQGREFKYVCPKCVKRYRLGVSTMVSMLALPGA